MAAGTQQEQSESMLWNNGSSQGVDCSVLNVVEIRSDGNAETWNGLVRAPWNYLLVPIASLWANIARIQQCWEFCLGKDNFEA